ncbi:unnamed protein product, partial [Arabidopsis halleri]
MEDSVTLILGEWSCSDTGEWRFVVRNGEMARCVAVKKDSSFSDLEREVERVFGVKRTETSIDLSFWFAGETTVFTQTKMPPVLIKSDVEYALFKEKKRESFGLHMYVTLKKLGCDIEESMEEEHANGYCGGDGLYEIDIDEVEEMISDTQLLAYVEEIEAAHKERMVEVGGGSGQIMVGQKRSGPESSSSGLVDKNLLRDVIVGGQTALVGGCDKGKAIVILEDNEVNGSVSVDVGEILRDEIEENLMDMSSNYDEEPDYNFDEWTERINNDYPPDWDPYNGLGEKEVEDVALGVMGEMGVYEVGGPSGEHEREVGEQITERQSLVDEIVPIGFSLGLEEEIGVLGREDENVGEQAIISSFMEEDMFGVIDVNDPLLLNDAPPVHDNMRGAPSDERNMDLKRASDAIYIGRIFANKAELHKFLSVYAMQRLFSFRVLKSDKGRAIVRCVDKKCDWRIYAVNHKDSENLEIRTARLKHTCDVSYRSRYSEKATAKILADLLCSKYANGKKGPRACELPEMVLAELNVTISYMKAWNTKELAIAAARGNEEESYKFLATYLHLVKSTNPGTITEMHTSKDQKGNTLFKYLFFAFGASIAGYKYLRKVIVIDGTAMKGKYKGCLVAASGQDGNMQIFPLAFGVVDGENEGGWVWFFKNLTKFVPDSEDLVFVSDRHASIYSGLRQVYPLAHHAACAVHLFRNVKHKFS